MRTINVSGTAATGYDIEWVEDGEVVRYQHRRLAPTLVAVCSRCGHEVPDRRGRCPRHPHAVVDIVERGA